MQTNTETQTHTRTQRHEDRHTRTLSRDTHRHAESQTPRGPDTHRYTPRDINKDTKDIQTHTGTLTRTQRDMSPTHRNTHQGYTWTHKVVHSERHTVRLTGTVISRAKVRGLMGRAPNFCWFPKTERKGGPLTT